MADPQVDLVARPVGASLPSASNNSALQLAESLQGVNEELRPALGAIGDQLKQRQVARAERDALSTSGQAFADAVKSGKLEPTQNPWYMTAYETKAAAVRGQGDMSALTSAAQSWTERSDPKAFASKWQQEVGKLSQNYASVDQTKGFLAAADPISQQVLNSNVEYNVQRIQQENTQNTTTLMGTAIENAYKANPKATPEQLFAAIEPQRQLWLGTGGTDQAFNQLIRGAFTNAAASVGDADMLDALKWDRAGKGSIYNMVNANGEGVGADIESDKYRIQREQNYEGMGQILKQQHAIEKEGFDVQTWAYAKYGWDLMNGKVAMSQVMTDAQAKGFSPQGVQAFLKNEAQDLSANNTYQRAQTQQYALSPNNQEKILSLRTEALKGGWSSNLEQKVWAEVRTGMDENVANDILSKADSTSKYLTSEGRADVRDARAQSNFDRQMHSQANHDFKEHRADLVGMADVRLQALGDKSLANNTQARNSVERSATDFGNAYLLNHQNDYEGANKAMEDYFERYLKLRVGRLQGSSTSGSLQKSSNPRAH